MAEVVVAASECCAGTLHLWPEIGWLEVLRDGGDIPVPHGTTGRLIATGLLNADMPLIRYMVGDRGKVASAVVDGTSCRCGRMLPALHSIEGRANDLLITHDGRRTYCPLSTIFSALPVCEAQIIQENMDQIRIRYVPAPSFTRRDEGVIRSRLQERIGKVEVLFERTTTIPRGSNGKFQPVVCKLPEKERGDTGQAVELACP
jgi:phenylacetate-CoA ligase